MLRVSIHQLPDLLDPFQSSPTPKGGRYDKGSDGTLNFLGFQSSPTPKGGRYVVACAFLHVVNCFNPRPPRKVGATLSLALFFMSSTVSILAHPERWALPWRLVDDVYLRHVSILAHPERWALRWSIRTFSTLVESFNPRPPRKVGATRSFHEIYGHAI